MKLTLSVASLALISVSLADDKVSPITKYEAGKTYHQEMTMVQDVTTPGGEMHTEMKSTISMKVVAGEKDGKKITMTYDSMKMKTGMGDKDVLNFDSDAADADKNPAAASLGKIVGQDVDIFLDKDNKVVKVDGLEELASNPMMKQMFNSANMKDLISQNGLIGAPNHAVAKGDTWQFAKSMPNPMMSITTKGQYTYTANVVEDGHALAVFDLDGELAMGDAPKEGEEEEKDEKEDAQTTQAKEMMKSMGIKLSDGKMTGKSYFDAELGFVRHAEVETEMTISLKNPGTQELMKMPTKQTVSVKLTSVEASKK
jgi:hypothetical protein